MLSDLSPFLVFFLLTVLLVEKRTTVIMSQTDDALLQTCDRCNKPILEVEVNQPVANDGSETNEEVTTTSKKVSASIKTQKKSKPVGDAADNKKRKTPEAQTKPTKRKPKKVKSDGSRRPNRNGYTEFAADYYRGNMSSQVVGNNLRERAQFIAAEWKKLSNEEKEVYKQRARLIVSQSNEENQKKSEI